MNNKQRLDEFEKFLQERDKKKKEKFSDTFYLILIEITFAISTFGYAIETNSILPFVIFSGVILILGFLGLSKKYEVVQL